MPADFVLPPRHDNPHTSALIRTHDWASSPLGPMESWPAELRTLVRLMLRSKTPQHLVWGPEHCLLYNDGYIPLLGGKHPEAMGRVFSEVWPEIWDEVEEIVARTSAGESNYFEDRPFLLRRGTGTEPAWISFAYTPVEDDAGNIQGFHSLFFETTAKVLAEKDRLEETERLRMMFDQAPGFIAVLMGPEHVFTLVNRAYLQLIGHREAVGLPVHEALPEAAGQGFLTLLDRVYATGKPYVGQRVPIALQPNPEEPSEQHYVDFVYQPLLDADGGVRGVFVQGSDVTSHQRAEEELRDLSEDLRRESRRKDEFLATLAHELRNPLAPIRTGLSVLALSPSPEQAAHTREVMDRQLRHMVRLIDDLLDIARINSNKIELRSEVADIDELVRSALETSRPAIDAAGHQLFLSLPARPLHVRADPTRISQVISNLLNNAAKYTPDHGRIEVLVEAEADDVVVRVSDNGVGIAADALPHVFDLFSQVGRSSDQSQGGLGIGLALVRRIAEMHGGSVDVRSEGPGRGSTFSLRLPAVAVAADDTAGAAATAGPAPAASPMRILVVDDNLDAAETMRHLLELLGHEVAVAHDGPAAVDAVAAFDPQLVFLDIGLPGFNGYEVARRLRASYGPACPAIVAVTGWGAPGDVEHARAGGFDRHMTKPVDPRDVESVIVEVQQQCQSPPEAASGEPARA